MEGVKTKIKKRRKKEYQGLLFILPSLLGVLVFYIIPYLDVFRRAFTQTLTGEFTGFANFISVLENPAFRLAAANTVRMMAVSVPMLVIVSLILAVPLQRGI